MLEVENLCVEMGGTQLLRNVSFRLSQGQLLCVVGQSGAGKSTLLKALQGLMPATWDRFTVTGQPRADRLGLPQTRWVMQDPLAALNPRRTLGQSIAESLHRSALPLMQVKDAVIQALAAVELAADFADRLPGQVSLGQAQRACLARALIAKPKLVIFDEPLSALDAMVQKKVARQMDALRQQTGAAYLVVTHDMGFAAAYADDILVLHRGQVEAYQPRDTFFAAPASAYAAQLIEAARTLGALEDVA